MYEIARGNIKKRISSSAKILLFLKAINCRCSSSEKASLIDLLKEMHEVNAQQILYLAWKCCDQQVYNLFHRLASIFRYISVENIDNLTLKLLTVFLSPSLQNNMASLLKATLARLHVIHLYKE